MTKLSGQITIIVRGDVLLAPKRSKLVLSPENGIEVAGGVPTWMREAGAHELQWALVVITRVMVVFWVRWSAVIA